MARRTRKTRDEQLSSAQEGWQPNLLFLIVIAVLFSVVAALFLRSNQGRPLGLPGAYAWVSALAIAFILRLLILARFVVPPEAESGAGASAGRERGWREGLRMLLYYFSVLAMPEWLRNRWHPARRAAPFELPPSFAEFDAGFVDSHRFLVLGRSTHFSRAAGPGYVHVQKGERIEEAVDLRRQERQQVVEAMTRDGIELEASITVSFQIRSVPLEDEEGNPLQPPTPGVVPYPYDDEVAFRLTYADGMGPTSEIPWNERIHPRAAALLVAELATYRLDQLFLPVPDAMEAGAEDGTVADSTARAADQDSGGSARGISPIQAITHKVYTKLSDEELLQIFDCSEAEECPVEILSVSVDRLQPPEDVLKERIESWHGAWQRRRARDDAGPPPDPEVERARAAAMLRIVEQVMGDIEKIEGAERRVLCDAVLQNVTTLMERLAIDGEPHVLPQHNREALEDASMWLSELSGQGGE